MLSAEKAQRLHHDIEDYLAVKTTIKTGLDRTEEIRKQREHILDYFKATEADWQDYRWQLKHRITDAAQLGALLSLSTPKQSGAPPISGSSWKMAWKSWNPCAATHPAWPFPPISSMDPRDWAKPR